MITVLGADGQLGTAFRRLLPDARFLTRADVDLAAPDELSMSLGKLPGPLINCAAWTDVDLAESREEAATVVNGRAVGVLAALCHEQGERFVTYSTDYVFGGTATRPYGETSATNPVNAYGRSKLAGETAALAFGTATVIRTSWVQSGTHPCFIRTMVRLASQGRDLRVVDDQFGRPTFAADLARATLQVLDADLTGLLHLANQGVTTWYELAAAAIRGAGIEPHLAPCPTADYPTPAARPAYSVLDTSRAAEAGIAMRGWTEALEEAIPEMLSDQSFPGPRRTIPDA